jgi:hypothetical protein
MRRDAVLVCPERAWRPVRGLLHGDECLHALARCERRGKHLHERRDLVDGRGPPRRLVDLLDGLDVHEQAGEVPYLASAVDAQSWSVAVRRKRLSGHQSQYDVLGASMVQTLEKVRRSKMLVLQARLLNPARAMSRPCGVKGMKFCEEALVEEHGLRRHD